MPPLSSIRSHFCVACSHLACLPFHPYVHTSAWRVLTSQPWQLCSADGSDQQLWIHFLTRTSRPFIELPISFNAYAWQMNQSSGEGNGQGTPWCKRTHVLHKTSRLTKKGLSNECLQYFTSAMRDIRAPLSPSAASFASRRARGRVPP